MPGIVGHMVVAKLVGKRLGIETPEFIRGNLLPDIWNGEDPHHKVQGKYFKIPDREFIRTTIRQGDDLSIGYCTHLLLDWHFLEEFVPEKIGNLNVFQERTIYTDYDRLNYPLVKRFALDTDELEKILYNMGGDINREKLIYNLNCLKMKEETKEPEYLKEGEFSTFLFDISKTISKEIEDYASKSNRQFVYNGKRKK